MHANLLEFRVFHINWTLKNAFRMEHLLQFLLGTSRILTLLLIKVQPVWNQFYVSWPVVFIDITIWSIKLSNFVTVVWEKSLACCVLVGNWSDILMVTVNRLKTEYKLIFVCPDGLLRMHSNVLCGFIV